MNDIILKKRGKRILYIEKILTLTVFILGIILTSTLFTGVRAEDLMFNNLEDATTINEISTDANNDRLASVIERLKQKEAETKDVTTETLDGNELADIINPAVPINATIPDNATPEIDDSFIAFGSDLIYSENHSEMVVEYDDISFDASTNTLTLSGINNLPILVHNIGEKLTINIDGESYLGSGNNFNYDFNYDYRSFLVESSDETPLDITINGDNKFADKLYLNSVGGYYRNLTINNCFVTMYEFYNEDADINLNNVVLRADYIVNKSITVNNSNLHVSDGIITGDFLEKGIKSTVDIGYDSYGFYGLYSSTKNVKIESGLLNIYHSEKRRRSDTSNVYPPMNIKPTLSATPTINAGGYNDTELFSYKIYVPIEQTINITNITLPTPGATPTVKGLKASLGEVRENKSYWYEDGKENVAVEVFEINKTYKLHVDVVGDELVTEDLILYDNYGEHYIVDDMEYEMFLDNVVREKASKFRNTLEKQDTSSPAPIMTKIASIKYIMTFEDDMAENTMQGVDGLNQYVQGIHPYICKVANTDTNNNSNANTNNGNTSSGKGSKIKNPLTGDTVNYYLYAFVTAVILLAIVKVAKKYGTKKGKIIF